ncbi:MAG TPA: ATP-binding protein [Bacteroidales bacterium]|nr:ATP-binding protein [Bacteroidales bacterium]HQI45943.1 ATP-binding protein [Bacteroidales bacterium]
MIKRIAEKKLSQLARTFKLVGLTGPRQSGKTTLVKQVFRDKPYVSLENPDARRFAMEDTRGFLETYAKGAVLDEVQRVPDLFSYLQEIADNSRQKGLFILTGSNNFQLQQSISQSLAGRIGSMVLPPFSLVELKPSMIPASDDELMLKGFYPPVYDQKIPSQDWYPNYIRTYIEKDVRQIKNISDLITFERFMLLLAGRCGQELNMSALSVESGVDVKTIQSWLGILESSYIVYLLKPHSNNFKKTVVKRPKVYFYDTALVCSLLSIHNALQLQSHPTRGALFENMVVTELVKQRLNAGKAVNLFYWRDKAGHEIDLIIDNAGKLLPIEIKSGKSINSDFFKNIDYWCGLSGVVSSNLLYAGNTGQKRSNGTEVMNWRSYLSL